MTFEPADRFVPNVAEADVAPVAVAAVFADWMTSQPVDAGTWAMNTPAYAGSCASASRVQVRPPLSVMTAEAFPLAYAESAAHHGDQERAPQAAAN